MSEPLANHTKPTERNHGESNVVERQMVPKTQCQKRQLHEYAKHAFQAAVVHTQQTPTTLPDRPEIGWNLAVCDFSDLAADERSPLAEGKDHRWLSKLFGDMGSEDGVGYHTAGHCCPEGFGKVEIKLDDRRTRDQTGYGAKAVEHDISVTKPETVVAIGRDASLAELGCNDIKDIAGQWFVRPDGIPVSPAQSLGYVLRDLNRLLGLSGEQWEHAIMREDEPGAALALAKAQPVEGGTRKLVGAWLEPSLLESSCSRTRQARNSGLRMLRLSRREVYRELPM